MPRKRWIKQRQKLVSRYFAGERAITEYREIIERTPLDKPLTVNGVLRRIRVDGTRKSANQIQELKERVRRAISIRNTVRSVRHLSMRRLFFMSFGIKFPENFEATDASFSFHSYGIHWELSKYLVPDLNLKQPGASGKYFPPEYKKGKLSGMVTCRIIDPAHIAAARAVGFTPISGVPIRRHEIEHLHSHVIALHPDKKFTYLRGLKEELISHLENGKTFDIDIYLADHKPIKKADLRSSIQYYKRHIKDREKILSQLISLNAPHKYIVSAKMSIARSKDKIKSLTEFLTDPSLPSFREQSRRYNSLVKLCERNNEAVTAALKVIPRKRLKNIVSLIRFQNLSIRLPKIVKDYRKRQRKKTNS